MIKVDEMLEGLGSGTCLLAFYTDPRSAFVSQAFTKTLKAKQILTTPALASFYKSIGW